ncbi:MAG: 3-isopropylmalate dehydratase small subunit, partial [Bryobacteraceae bacterium]
RNAINLGLPAIVSPTASQECREGDDLEIDLAAGVLRNLTRNLSIPAAPLDPRAIELIRAGGLIPYLKARYAAPAAG